MPSVFEPVFLPTRDLAVSFLSGMDGRAVLRSTELLAGAGVLAPAPLGGPGSAAELGHRLADRLVGQLVGGARGRLAVPLHGGVDLLEFVLHFEHRIAAHEEERERWGETLGEEAPATAPRILVHDLVAIVGVDEFERELWADEPSDDDAPGALADRLEIATVVALDGTDRADPADDAEAGATPERIRALVRALNPEVTIGTTDALPQLASPTRTLVPGLGYRQAASMGWQCALDHDPAAAGPIDTLVFRDPRPFHPGRLAAALECEVTPERCGRILRSRGLVRLASRPGRIGLWSSAGARVSLDPVSADAGLDGVGGELVFFGEGLQRERLEAALLGAVVSTDELLDGPEAWAAYEDPFPAW